MNPIFDTTSECHAVYLEWWDDEGKKREQQRLGAFLTDLLKRIDDLNARVQQLEREQLNARVQQLEREQ